MPVIDGRGTRPVVSSGDLAFLQQKEQEGKLKTNEGSLSAIGDLASITASSNKDLYIARARCVASLETDAIDNVSQVVLKVNGVIKETASSFLAKTTVQNAGSTSTTVYEFSCSGLKVTSGQIIKLEVISIGSSTTIDGFLECWEESSGSQSFGGQTVTFQTEGGDLSFLRDKERAGDLVKLVSPEFSADADQITFVPPNGKTFFFSRARLYPVTDTVTLIAGSLGNTALTRRADIEITNDGTIVDVLTHDHWSRQADADMSSGVNTGQYESNIFDSLVGDGIKEFKLVSTNTSGTFRVSLFGWLEDT